MNKILYLHGFASASDSTKAQQLNSHIKNNTSDISIHIPNIENNISLAVDQIERLIKKIKPTVIMGCSLGGFFGTYFSEKYNLKCVGINPAVIPPAEMSSYLGKNENYSTGEKFIIDKSQLDLLDEMGKEIKKIRSPKNFLILLQSKDELLDYKEAISFYKGAVFDITFGGNHSFEKFDTHFKKIEYFLNMH